MKELSRQPSFADRAAKQISQAVLCGEIPLDKPLRENALMSELGVSRNTVREALLLLQSEGLVEILPHRGAYVSSLTGRQILETYSLRAILEPYAARLAMSRHALDGNVLAELRQLVLAMQEAQLAGDLFHTIAADADFHFIISRASGHELLTSICMGLLTRTRLSILGILQSEPVPPLDADDHLEIVGAIEEGNCRKLRSAIGHHLARAVRSHHIRDAGEADPESSTGPDRLHESPNMRPFRLLDRL